MLPRSVGLLPAECTSPLTAYISDMQLTRPATQTAPVHTWNPPSRPRGQRYAGDKQVSGSVLSVDPGGLVLLETPPFPNEAHFLLTEYTSLLGAPMGILVHLFNNARLRYITHEYLLPCCGHSAAIQSSGIICCKMTTSHCVYISAFKCRYYLKETFLRLSLGRYKDLRRNRPSWSTHRQQRVQTSGCFYAFTV